MSPRVIKVDSHIQMSVPKGKISPPPSTRRSPIQPLMRSFPKAQVPVNFLYNDVRWMKSNYCTRSTNFIHTWSISAPSFSHIPRDVMWRVLERRRPNQKHITAQKCHALILGEQYFPDIKNTFQRIHRCRQRRKEGGTIGKDRVAGALGFLVLTRKRNWKGGDESSSQAVLCKRYRRDSRRSGVVSAWSFPDGIHSSSAMYSSAHGRRNKFWGRETQWSSWIQEGQSWRRIHTQDQWLETYHLTEHGPCCFAH